MSRKRGGDGGEEGQAPVAIPELLVDRPGHGEGSKSCRLEAHHKSLVGGRDAHHVAICIEEGNPLLCVPEVRLTEPEQAEYREGRGASNRHTSVPAQRCRQRGLCYYITQTTNYMTNDGEVRGDNGVIYRGVMDPPSNIQKYALDGNSRHLIIGPCCS